MKKLAALTLSLFLTSGIALADSPKDADAQPAKSTLAKAKEAKDTDKADSAIAAEIEELRQTLQSQQEQLQLLKEELHKRDRQIDEAREAAAAANSRAAEANVKATEAVTASVAAKPTAEVISNNAGGMGNGIATTAQADGKAEGPGRRAVIHQVQGHQLDTRWIHRRGDNFPHAGNQCRHQHPVHRHSFPGKRLEQSVGV